MSTDVDRALQTNLAVLCDLLEADAAAIFRPAGDGQLSLRQSTGLHQDDLDVAHVEYGSRRAALGRGDVQRAGTRTLWPLLGPQRDLVAVLYFAALPPHQGGTVHAAVTRVLLQLVEWLHAEEVRPPAAAPRIVRFDMEEALRQELVAAALACAGNVSAIAGILGVTRQTVYVRAERYGLDLRQYRVRGGRR